MMHAPSEQADEKLLEVCGVTPGCTVQHYLGLQSTCCLIRDFAAYCCGSLSTCCRIRPQCLRNGWDVCFTVYQMAGATDSSRT